MTEAEAEEAADRLAASRAPLLVGVRHHSPALAAAMPALLDAARPERVFLELPADLQPWVRWLAEPGLVAPVALAGARDDGALFFYPFADFSPELAAIRWARANDVPVVAFDLPCAEREDSGDEETAGPGDGERLVDALGHGAGASGSEALWERLVEAHAPLAAPEEIRRAALAFGWALRRDAHHGGGVPERDRRREAYMRQCLGGARDRAVAVVGAFHAAALVDPPLLDAPLAGHQARPGAPVATSLVAYAFELFDARSGYSAGIRDPLWQQRVYEAARAGVLPTDAARAAIVAVARELRARGHVAGVPDAKEAARLAIDLAALRGLRAPGRRELLEGIESALGRGEPLGRGRVLARALDQVLVGRARGRLAPGTPRSGLGPHVERLLAELGLPGPGPRSREPETITLDPLRSDLDRRRHVTLERLLAAGVPYGSREDQGEANLGARWTVAFTPAIEARIELAGLRGVTLPQAAAGALGARRRALEEAGRRSARSRLGVLEEAARAGLGELVADELGDLAGPFLAEAGLAELVDAIALVDRIARGLFPGLPDRTIGELAAFTLPRTVRRDDLLAAAVAALEALAGSDRDEDAMALLELVRLRAELDDPGGRLGHVLDRLAAGGSPKLEGAAGALRVALGRDAGRSFGVRVGSWIDAGAETAARLRGALLVAAPLLEADGAFLGEVSARIAALDDATFLARLPALRDGFDALSPAARERVLVELADQLGLADPRGAGLDVTLEDAPVIAGWLAAADAAGRAALAGAGLPIPAVTPTPNVAEPADERLVANGAIALHDRLRLVLGRERARLDPAALPAGLALEELYGRGRGEGSRRGVGAGGGTGPAFPTVREWSAELEALFGAEVREEVLGRAADRGRLAAALEIDPARVTPSIELLETLLALKGGLPEAQLARLRRLVERIVRALAEALATRVRPALVGLATPRATRRRTGRLDLGRTVLRNLHTARRGAAGGVELVPERLLWRERAKRTLDWHLTLVVDVSGSMEPSVIHAALMAGILNALPALTVRFYAFNTGVVDLTGLVDDPLALLLEIAIGGGTHIAQALAYARARLPVPQRSIVVVVSDFEEGESVPALVAEARALVETGARVLGLAALDEAGRPRYQRAIAEQLVGAGMHIAALTPLELARWVAEQLR